MRKRWTFEEWMAVIDGLLERKTGLSSSDFTDHPYHDWYDGGMAPKSAASRALRAEGDCL